MTTSFSWTDTFQIAFSNCLPCISSRPSNGDASASTDSLLDPDRNNPTAHRIRRARPDELEGLLMDPETDNEAERMSLHSNPGRSTRRKKPKKSSKKGKGITLFGYDLFGKPAPPPIHLPESDDESTSALAPPAATTRSSSGGTFDSDAAPLDSAAIENLTGSSAAMQRELAAREAAEEEERRRKEEKAERRAKRRQKREMKKLTRALEEGSQASGEAFEGFPGSGTGGDRDSYPGMPSFEGYGPFVSARSPSPTKSSHRAVYRDLGPDEDEDDADLDGQVYARRSRDPGSGSRSGSDSRSRTSASRSDAPTPLSQTAFHISSQSQGFQPPPSPGMLLPGSGAGQTPTKKHKSSKSKSSSKLKSVSTNSHTSTSTSRHSRSNTSASTSQSPSLPSPTSVTFGLVSPPPQLQSGTYAHVPTLSKLKSGQATVHEDDFDGSQGLTEADMPSPGFGFPTDSPSQFPSTGFSGFPGTGLRRNTIQGSDFPSAGLGMGRTRPNRADSLLAKGGAFLATRGDSVQDEL